MTKKDGFTEADVPDQSGKCFLVTGANTGLGFEVSRVLATRGARVLMACRDRAKAEAAMASIRSMVADTDLAFLPLDQSDLDSVRRAAELAEKEPRIDVLINNAGVMTPPLTRTRQGFELQFGVNHLGSFALTSLLLPKLSQAPQARVVVTSSLAHRGATIEWDDLHAETSYVRARRYGASKLANALFLFTLDRRLRAAGSSVTAVGCHPGFAATDLARHLGPFRILMPLVKLLANSAAMGALPTLQAATGVVKPGAYYGPIGFGGIRGPSGEAPRDERALDEQSARRLWDVSVALTGIAPDLPPCAS